MVLYGAYGTPSGAVVMGRVLEDVGPRAADPERSPLANAVDTLNVLESDEIEGARVQVTLGSSGTTLVVEAQTDEDGVWTVETGPIALAPGKYPVRARVIGPVVGDAVEGILHLLADTATLIVVSDFDDTVVASHATEKLKLLWQALTRNAAQLAPVRGAPEMYRRGAASVDGFFYVSASPQNFAERIQSFLRLHRFPPGPVLLKNWGEDSLLNHAAYKKGRIVSLIERFPQARFILIGDSGESDPDVYGSVRDEYPSRIAAIVIRELAGRPLENDGPGMVQIRSFEQVPRLLTHLAMSTASTTALLGEARLARQDGRWAGVRAKMLAAGARLSLDSSGLSHGSAPPPIDLLSLHLPLAFCVASLFEASDAVPIDPILWIDPIIAHGTADAFAVVRDYARLAVSPIPILQRLARAVPLSTVGRWVGEELQLPTGELGNGLLLRELLLARGGELDPSMRGRAYDFVAARWTMAPVDDGGRAWWRVRFVLQPERAGRAGLAYLSDPASRRVVADLLAEFPVASTTVAQNVRAILPKAQGDRLLRVALWLAAVRADARQLPDFLAFVESLVADLPSAPDAPRNSESRSALAELRRALVGLATLSSPEAVEAVRAHARDHRLGYDLRIDIIERLAEAHDPLVFELIASLWSEQARARDRLRAVCERFGYDVPAT